MCVSVHIWVLGIPVSRLKGSMMLSLYLPLQVVGVKQVESGEPVKFSTEVLFMADRYEIV